MKTCNQYFEQIIHFDELNEAEKNQIKTHAKTCEVCQKHLREITSINGALKQFQQTKHIVAENLTRYGIYIADPKNADYDGKKLTDQEISTIQNHLKHCNECQLKIDQIQEEFNEIESFLEEAEVPNVTIGAKIKNSKISEIITINWNQVLNSIQEFLFPSRNRMVPAAVMTFATLLIVVWFSPLFRGETESFFKLAIVNKGQIQHVTRSLGSQLASDGFAAFNEGDYKTAITLLEKYVKSDSVAISLAYVHKQIGIAYLLESKKGFLGRFKSFKVEGVNLGINHLQKVLDLTDNTRLREDAFWYLGKAHLMKNEIHLAKKSFDSVIKLKGKKVEQAEIILADLAKF